MGSGGGGQTIVMSDGSIQETPDQLEQAKINQELWNYYQTSYRPLIEGWAQKVTDPAVQAAEEQKVAGQIRGEVMRNLDPNKASVNPVKNTRQLNDLSTIESGAQVQGQGGVRSRQLKDVQNIIDIGRGQATQASVGLDDIASQSVSTQLHDLNLQQQSQAVQANSIGYIAGILASPAWRTLKPAANPTPKPQ